MSRGVYSITWGLFITVNFVIIIKKYEGENQVQSFKKHVYLLISKGTVKATELTTGAYLEVNLPASAHPRTHMGSFVEIEKAFSQIMKEISAPSFFKPAPVAYVHLIDEVEGGYTDVELKAFMQAVLSAGAREVYMPDSRVQLTKEQLLDKQFDQFE